MAKGPITRGRAFALFVPIVVILVVLDQVTKVLARANLVQGNPVTVIPHLFDFDLVYNSGAAFGSFGGATTVFLVIACVIVAFIIVYLAMGKRRTYEAVLLGFVVAGAIGNCLDRIFQGGLVTDFIATTFIDFPVFNVADICITCGCVLFFIFYFFVYRSSKQDGAGGSDNEGQGDGE